MRGGAFLLEEGGAAGLDILDQFSHLLGESQSRDLTSDNDDLNIIILGSINSQQSTRFSGNNNNFNNNEQSNTNNMTLGDLATLLRGSANILENNAPRLNNIVNQASQQC